MRSNSKQPFWLTGDMMPIFAMVAFGLSKRGWASVSSFMLMPGERIAMGLEGGGAPSARVAAAMAAVTFTEKDVAWEVDWGRARCY